MLKKSSFFLCTLLYFHIFPQIQLTSQELNIYKTIKTQYSQNPSKLYSFLQSNQLSIKNARNILEKQKNILNNEISDLYDSMSYSRFHTPGGNIAAIAGGFAALAISAGSLILSGSTLALGAFIKQKFVPSTLQKLTSYSLMGFSAIALIPEVLIEIEPGGLVSLLLEKAYKEITNPFKEKAIQEKIIERELIEKMLSSLSTSP